MTLCQIKMVAYEREGSKSQENTIDFVYEKPLTHTSDFFFGTWLVKLPHFYLTLVMAFVAWSGWPWLFFMTYWNNTSSSYLPVCVFVHTANPFPVMKTGFSLWTFSHREIPVMKTGSLQWEQGSPVMKTGFSLLGKVHRENPVFITGMGLQWREIMFARKTRK